MAANNRKRPAVVDPRAAERRHSLMIRLGATAVVVVIAVAIGVWLIITKEDDSSSSASGSAPSSGSSAPSMVTDTGAYRVTGTGSKKATLRLVEDFQCPACKQFETIFSDALEQIRANPQVAVDYKPIAFLDRMSSTQYSTRSANASACVAQETATTGDWATWLKFHDALYAQQPAEQSSGLTDQALTSIATGIGAPQSVSSCIADGTYTKWVGTETAKVEADNFQGTPQVELNGKLIELSTPEALLSAVNAAVAQ